MWASQYMPAGRDVLKGITSSIDPVKKARLELADVNAVSIPDDTMLGMPVVTVPLTV